MNEEFSHSLALRVTHYTKRVLKVKWALANLSSGLRVGVGSESVLLTGLVRIGRFVAS
jgi:hypothetical protein